MATVHLYTLGYRGNDLINFDIKLHNPSRIATLQEITELQQKLDVAAKARTDVYSNRWIATNILGLSEQELVRNTREKFYDKQIETALAKVGEAQGEALAGETLSGAGFGGPGDLGLDDPAIEDTLDVATEPEVAPTPSPEETEPTPEPEAAAGDEDVLLATPGGGGKKPDKAAAIYTEFADGTTTTNKSKGKRYKPVETDRREYAGALESWGARGYRQAQDRNIADAMRKGTFISENKSNYSEDFENKMSSLNEEMNKILSEDL